MAFSQNVDVNFVEIAWGEKEKNIFKNLLIKRFGMSYADSEDFQENTLRDNVNRTMRILRKKRSVETRLLMCPDLHIKKNKIIKKSRFLQKRE